MKRAAWLADQLPRGSQIWIPFGGAMAVSPEWDVLRLIESGVRSQPWAFSEKKNKGKAPEPMPYPDPEKRFKPSSKRKKKGSSGADFVSDRARKRKAELDARRNQ